MLVFLTGATGFIGSRILAELIAAGHNVLGLVRSDAAARRLEEAGARPILGTLEDPASLAQATAQTDAVIHTAFDHDFSRFAENCEKDRRAILAMGEALRGSGRPLIITSVVAMGITTPGQPALEHLVDWEHPAPRALSERAAVELRSKDVSVAVVRLPQVHDQSRQGFVTSLIDLARVKGVSAYVGNGTNRWSAVHVDDVARLYRLALERHQAGLRYHAVAEEGVPVRSVAETIGAKLGVPVVSVSREESQNHFGWLATFAERDMSASSARTRESLGWQPNGPSLLEDLRRRAHRPAS